MKTIAFFSYKGGVGRTLAATNFAVYLAKLGLQVVIIDFDLDAPGVDSKFPGFQLPDGQLGMLDYILEFQRHGTSPGSIEPILCRVPIPSPRLDCSLGLIPAGDYLSPSYSAKLNEVDWSQIFSDERDGVAFFQRFLERIEKDENADVLIIDSRTGFSEIGGLCTQQLADETVILSSLAGESVKMTRHLEQLIRESEIARRLDKEVETKIVVSRVPKPAEIDKLKSECCKKFDVSDSRLFFLFSCPELEREEFVAMLDTQREDGLVSSYVQLFQGLDVQVAQDSIKEEIERAERGILSCSKEEAETRIREMVALFPHPEVYRTAMRFFDFKERDEQVAIFGVRLLDLLPDDDEAIRKVSSVFLRREQLHRGMHFGRTYQTLAEIADVSRLLSICKRAHSKGQLSIVEEIRLADALEDDDDHETSFAIAMECLSSEEINNSKLRLEAMAIAARTAMRIGKVEEAQELVSKIPPSRLTGSLANIAIRLKAENSGKEEAFEFAKLLIAQDNSPPVLSAVAELAQELGKTKEFQEFVRETAERSGWNPEAAWAMERYGFEMPPDEFAAHRPRPRVGRRVRHSEE